MLTPAEIKAKGFKKDLLGYNVEEVDGFLMKFYESYEAIYSENAELTEKIDLLIDKIEQYRRDESVLKDSIISTQKLNDSILREANKRAQLILQDAQIKGDKLIDNAKKAIISQKEEFDELQRRIATFREQLLSAYKNHLEEIRTLPVFEDKSACFEPPLEPAGDSMPQKKAPSFKPESTPEKLREPEPEPKPEPEPEPVPDSKARPEPDLQPEPEPEEKADQRSVAESEPEPVQEFEPEEPPDDPPMNDAGDTREFEKVTAGVPAAQNAEAFEQKPFKLNINFDEELSSAVPDNIREDLRFGADYHVEDEVREDVEGGVFSRLFRKKK